MRKQVRKLFKCPFNLVDKVIHSNSFSGSKRVIDPESRAENYIHTAFKIFNKTRFFIPIKLSEENIVEIVRMPGNDRSEIVLYINSFNGILVSKNLNAILNYLQMNYDRNITINDIERLNNFRLFEKYERWASSSNFMSEKTRNFTTGKKMKEIILSVQNNTGFYVFNNAAYRNKEFYDGYKKESEKKSIVPQIFAYYL